MLARTHPSGGGERWIAPSSGTLAAALLSRCGHREARPPSPRQRRGLPPSPPLQARLPRLHRCYDSCITLRVLETKIDAEVQVLWVELGFLGVQEDASELNLPFDSN